MRLSKKATAVAAGVALLMTLGSSAAMADRNNDDGDRDRVTICHRTASETNPWVELEVSEQGAERHLRNHDDDFRVRPGHPCPPDGDNGGGGDDDGDDRDRRCIATSESENETGDQRGLVNVGTINLGLNNVAGNLLCQADVLNNLTAAVLGHAIGGDSSDDDGEGSCVVKSESDNETGDQRGLVNVGTIDLGLNNVAGNLLCQSDVANGLTAAVLGTAIGGDSSDDDGEGTCKATSDSDNETGDQRGLVNVGTVDAGLDNVAANALCQSDVLNDATVAVLGTAIGGDADGDGDFILGGLLDGGLLGGDGILSILLGADADVMGSLGILF